MNPTSFRIGQIVPSSNTTMETELPELFRPDSRVSSGCAKNPNAPSR